MIRKVLRKIKSVFNTAESHYYTGDFSSFDDALKHCKGYAAEEVFKKTCETALKVQRGDFVFERDSVGFTKAHYSFAAVAALQNIATKNNNELELTDFGGSLGSSYFQHKIFFSSLKKLQWRVVELPNIIDFGKANLQDDHLFFYHTLAEAEAQQKSTVLFSSSTLQSVPNPFEWMDEFIKRDYPYILLDRIAFVKRDTHQVTVQYTHEMIYEASYPAWFFNEQLFVQYFLERGYKVHFDFPSYCDVPMSIDKKYSVYWKGFFLEKN
jgi:putative methyltransferase (TIGR04325 family)